MTLYNALRAGLIKAPYAARQDLAGKIAIVTGASLGSIGYETARALAPLERLTLLTAEEGAQTSLYCATAPDAVGGQYFQQCRPRLSSADSQDSAVSSRLWEQTAGWVAQLQASVR